MVQQKENMLEKPQQAQKSELPEEDTKTTAESTAGGPEAQQVQQREQNGGGGTTGTAVKVGFYEVDRTIGKGNYAVVKLARHRITKTEVAIKIVDKRRLDSTNLAKVYREIEVLKKLRHPHIVRLYQVMETNNMLYLVTEYAPNGEIFDLISKQHRLTEENAREKFWQIISAVDYLHNLGIVHRDLKAENLLLDANSKIKLADFGFSNFFSPHDTLNTFCGSPPYAAPEVFEGKRYEGPEIDIWSLGVILYVMVCGVLPFEGVNLQLLRDRVLSGRIRIPYFMSSDCENLIRKMLTVDAKRRPTVEQIKQHKWMRYADFAHRFEQLQLGEQPQQQQNANGTEPHAQILRLMNNIGIESHKVRNALLIDSYDNFHAIYLLLLERLQRSSPTALSPSQSAACQPMNNNGLKQSTGTEQQPQIGLPEQSNINIVSPPTSKIAPAVLLTPTTNCPDPLQQQQQTLIRAIKARRQSDGVATLGGGLLAACQCCCCCQPKNRMVQHGIVTRQMALHHQQQQQQQQKLTANCSLPEQSAQAEQSNKVANGSKSQQPPAAQTQHAQVVHHASSDYESADCYSYSGSSAAGSTLSRQSTVGTINSFDEGIADESSAVSGGSGCVLLAGPPLPGHQFAVGGCAVGPAEQLPAFDSQLSQDPLFSSQCSSNYNYNSSAAFSGSINNGPAEGLPGAGCCCFASAGNGQAQMQMHHQAHWTRPGAAVDGAQFTGAEYGTQRPFATAHQHLPHHLQQQHFIHFHQHQQMLLPNWHPPALHAAHSQQQQLLLHHHLQQQQALLQQQRPNTARAPTEADPLGNGGMLDVCNLPPLAALHCALQHQMLFGDAWRGASDNAIGDSLLTFPTGQLGKRNRAVNELHRPSGSGPPLHAQLRRLGITTGLASLASAVPLAVGVTAPAPPGQTHNNQPTVAAQSPLSGGPPPPGVRALGSLPKRISLPENLEFQPQMLLSLKQSMHVEKQLTSNSECGDPCATDLAAFEKPLLKTSRLQQFQHQQQQKRKAARLQLLRQQSYQMAQKQSVISSSCPAHQKAATGGSPPAVPRATLAFVPPLLPFQLAKMELEQSMGQSAGPPLPPPAPAAVPVVPSAAEPTATNERTILSPIEDDLRAEEVMDTS